MKPPKQNAYVSLIGTILIMWLMVGYVYLLTPLDTITPPPPRVEPQPAASHAAARTMADINTDTNADIKATVRAVYKDSDQK
ncbi:MAG: hypothetical protein ACPGZU_00555 [Ketobacter sp.]|uniref:hypothetical protein n=1 Tax=unclassified Ketobacter TaxID=2639109 RepID=UPI000F28705C|nr:MULTISPECIES: hypothetical protein [unclassified Ketobacter]MCK5790391.1 hypothetical protein [Ketobacter sp.]MEC8812732.1 hypothetical protein [Pseudomonadota bacterium]RLT87361.1 MAG: hypothetical protein D9N13_23330 [Ketobacter sp. GenoA1]RLT94313.1 MAG: hypothetical protein D9N15_17930 [Ketobacter sp.]